MDDDQVKKDLERLEQQRQNANTIQTQTYQPNAEVNNQSQNGNPSIMEFIVGMALFGAGFFMVTQNTTIYSGFTLMNLIGFTPPFGVVLLPFLFGVGVLFYNEKSIIGWILTIFGFRYRSFPGQVGKLDPMAPALKGFRDHMVDKSIEF